MIVYNSAVGNIHPRITSGLAVTGTACAAGVENKHSVTHFGVAAVGVSEKGKITFFLLSLEKQLIRGIAHIKFMSVGEEDPFAVGEGIYVAYGGFSAEVAVARNAHYILIKIQPFQRGKVIFAVPEEDKKLGIAVPFEYFMHSGVIAVGIRKNYKSHIQTSESAF